MSSRIPLTQGRYAASVSPTTPGSPLARRYATNGYAIRSYTDPQGQPRYALMHRVTMQAKPGELVDHIDANRRQSAQQHPSQPAHRGPAPERVESPGQVNTSSRYKGVTSYRHGWRVRIRYYGQRIHLGYCQGQEEAALLYDAAARQLFDEEYARVNFPDRPTPAHIQERLDYILSRWEAKHGNLATSWDVGDG